jgi:hypothetical protein
MCGLRLEEDANFQTVLRPGLAALGGMRLGANSTTTRFQLDRENSGSFIAKNLPSCHPPLLWVALQFASPDHSHTVYHTLLNA